MKKCKGNGKAKGYGCGKPIEGHNYGLCKDCYAIFLSESPYGNDIIAKITKRAKKELEKKGREDIRKKKEGIKTLNEYKKELQTLVNFIIRQIDCDKGCISCNHGWDGLWTRQKQAGHYHPKHTNQPIRFNVFGIWTQCTVCNDRRSANIDGYRKGIINHYGQDMLDYIDLLPEKYRGLEFTIDSIKNAIIKAKAIKKAILSGRDYTRKEVNLLLSLYK